MTQPLVSAVIIGRNEGTRLERCLVSLQQLNFDQNQLEVIYVDSHSSDDSLDRARKMGARAISVPPGPTTAARGRNTGLAQAKGTFVFFLDGDTLVDSHFLKAAVTFLESNQNYAGVCGDRREIAPEASIYNLVQDLEWNGPPGPVAYFGGDTLVRKQILLQVGGYKEDLVAGEEPELCSRIRAAGFSIMHLAIPMTGHDLALYSFRGYWRRCYRTGHAYAEVADLTGGETFGPQSRRNLIQASIYLVFPLVLLLSLRLWAVPILLGGGTLLLIRTVLRSRWRNATLKTLLIYALHGHLCQIPIFLGQLKYFSNRRKRVASELIEYK